MPLAPAERRDLEALAPVRETTGGVRRKSARGERTVFHVEHRPAAPPGARAI